MSTNRTFTLAAALVIGLQVSAMAAPEATSALNETAKATAGEYEFSNADSDRRCMVNLKTDLAGAAGLKLEFDKGCTTAFPFAKEVSGWTIAENDFLRLLDAKGKLVIEFSEVESGIFEALRPGEGVLFLQNAAALAPPPPTAEQMAGEWNLLRGKDRLCSLTLANKPAANGNLALTVKPGCDAAIVQFGLSGWQMDDAELVMKGSEDRTWRFEEADDKTWQRIPQTRDPLALVRP
jgi:hypothetical protein